jgi:hypothetical protein
MHHACRLGIARKRAPDHRIESILHGERLVLAFDLGRIVEDYRALWLQRNRPGGLDDSVGRLERLVARYRA